MSQPGCDCNPCNDVTTQNTQGPKGDPGANGANGTNGLNAYTYLQVSFTVPAISTVVTLTVIDTRWMAAGEPIFIETAGAYLVSSITDQTHVVVVNLGYQGNAIPTTVISGSRLITPSGFKGIDGAGSGTTLNQLSPTTTKGDIIVDNGGNSPAASDGRFGVGSNGKVLVADSSQATGLNWTTITPKFADDNAIATMDGISGTPLPLQATKMIITDDGALQSKPTGGNARGNMAVDLQVDRTGAGQVASGDHAVISGGKSNTASGQTSTVAGGASNTAGGINSAVCGGVSNTAAGSNSVVCGGTGNLANSQNNAVLGGSGNEAVSQGAVCLGGIANTSAADYSISCGNGSVAGRYAEFAHAAGFFSLVGDAQTSKLVMRGVTTDGSSKEIFLDGISQRIGIGSDNISIAFRMLIVAHRVGGAAESAAYQLLGAIHQQSGSGTLAIVGAVNKTVIAENDASWDVAASADTVHDALILTVQGAVGKTIQWVATVELVQTNE